MAVAEIVVDPEIGKYEMEVVSVRVDLLKSTFTEERINNGSAKGYFETTSSPVGTNDRVVHSHSWGRSVPGNVCWDHYHCTGDGNCEAWKEYYRSGYDNSLLPTLSVSWNKYTTERVDIGATVQQLKDVGFTSPEYVVLESYFESNKGTRDYDTTWLDGNRQVIYNNITQKNSSKKDNVRIMENLVKAVQRGIVKTAYSTKTMDSGSEVTGPHRSSCHCFNGLYSYYRTEWYKHTKWHETAKYLVITVCRLVNLLGIDEWKKYPVIEEEEPIVPPEVEEEKKEASGGSGGGRTYRGKNYQSSGSGGGYGKNDFGDDSSEYDYIYIPEDIDITDHDEGIIVGGDVIGGQVQAVDAEGNPIFDEHGNPVLEDRVNKNISTANLKLSLTSPDILTIEEHVDYDTAGSFDLNQKIFCIIKAKNYFLGFVKQINRTLTSRGEIIKYVVVGIRSQLKSIPFSVQLKLTDYTLKELFTLVLNHIPSSVIADWDISVCPALTIPRIQSSQITVGQFINQLLEYAGHYSYYITTSKKFVLYDLKSGTSKNLYIPTIGTRLKDDYDKYTVMSKNLNFDVSQCKTRAIVYGDHYMTTVKINITGYYSTTKDAYYVDLPTSGGEILTSLPDGGSISIEIANPETQVVTITSPLHVNVQTGRMWFGYGSKDEDGNLFSSLKTYVTYGKRFGMIKADTGYQGTAYTEKSVQEFIFQLNTQYKKYDLCDGYSRDDTYYLQQLASKLIEPHKDIKWGGQVILDGINTDISLGDRVNFLGTSENWSSLNMVVLNITYNFKDKTTMLELTNNYWLYTGIIDPNVELKNKRNRENWEKKEVQYTVIHNIVE